VRKAKSSAFQFAQKIVQWVEDILKAFKDGDVGQFTEKTWDNLANVRCGKSACSVFFFFAYTVL
jgi:hypothetical protein